MKIEEKVKNLETLLFNLTIKYGDKAMFSSSLSWEDQVITHFIFENHLPIRVFTLDTGRMFPESYQVLNKTRVKYNRNIEVFFPETKKVEELMTFKGASSFYNSVEDRNECCFIRKVEPLNKALESADCWITGLRAEHSENRVGAKQFEEDKSRGLIKVNPIIDWTLSDVKNTIKKYSIPYNLLHDKGFVSIGCQPCTRAIKEGEAFRSGRWWWEDTSKKECGLHIKQEQN